jgi:bifunctional UDP-N-acetylglucosamine pyrophosphorylase / glucosamine-1-phosphate N-acetyltransferase
MNLAAVVLAAGQGTRMNSRTPKVLHKLAGHPLVEYPLRAAHAVTGATPVMVVGVGADAVMAAFEERARYVLQAEQLGTGHALAQARAVLEGQCEAVLVTYADMPLLREATLRALAEAQAANPGPFTLLSVHSAGPRDFGRVLRDADGRVAGVVEAIQATPEQYALTEVNVGAYCFDAAWLWQALPQLPLSPKGEYYLTDLVALAVAEGGRVGSVTTADESEAIGINTRVQLAAAETALRRRLNERWMLAGVTLVDPATTYIDPDAQLGADTIVLPNTHIEGHCVIAGGCVLGPNTILRDTTVGAGSRVEASVLEGALLAEDVRVGPFAHLRAGARLERGVHMGNFGEVKNATLGPGVKMGHFSYIGDSDIGTEANIGAGTITCNFDGYKKHHTTVGDHAFIGSDTLLVAPVTVGENARTGAGAVVTKNVPPDTLAVGVPARVIRRLK